MHRVLGLWSCLACFLWGCPDVDRYAEPRMGGIQFGESSPFPMGPGQDLEAAATREPMGTGGSPMTTDGDQEEGVEAFIDGGGRQAQEIGGGQAAGGTLGGTGGEEGMKTGGESTPPTADGEMGGPGGQEAGTMSGPDAGEATGTGEDETLCTVSFRVTLPDDTPPGDTIYMAGSFYDDEARDWQPHENLMTRMGTSATTDLVLRRGRSLQYKYTRGTWEQVEVSADCGERENRNVLVGCDSNPRTDRVDAWIDSCP